MDDHKDFASQFVSKTQPNLIMIGPQGSGKGTQAERLVQNYGYIDIATGQILREHVATHDQLGKQVARYLQAGELVPDSVVEDVVRERLAAVPRDRPIVFDGFPRNVRQAHILERLFITLERPAPIALYLRVSRAIVIERLAHRYVCTECGKILQFAAGVLHTCPFCNGRVETRTDDRPEVIEARLNLFFEQTLPVIDYYKHKRQLVEIDASATIDEVTTLIARALHFEVPHAAQKESTRH